MSNSKISVQLSSGYEASQALSKISELLSRLDGFQVLNIDSRPIGNVIRNDSKDSIVLDSSNELDLARFEQNQRIANNNR